MARFEDITARKDRLLTLLEENEKAARFKPQDRVMKHGFYDRMFNGVAIVSEVGKCTLRLIREDGRPLGILAVTPEIVEVTRKEDQFLATLGFRNGQWYMVRIQMIASPVKTRRGPPQFHMSVSMDNMNHAIAERSKSLH